MTVLKTGNGAGPDGPGDASANTCRVSGLSYSYGDRAALRDISFTVERGQMLALVGPSGAGKTTLLRLMTGMFKPMAGEVMLYGVRPGDLKDAAERTRLVGMMQQRLDLVPQLSARHNTDAGMLGRWSLLRSLGALVLPLSHGPTSEALERVGLSGRESERVSRLSGGEQQRVAMARLLVQDPGVMVADEPVASLDPALAGDLLGLLRDISRERGRTVIASLHAPELARTHFDRVVGLRDGSVAFDVAADDLSRDLLEAVYRREPAAELADRGQSEERTGLWGI
ncbi:MAG: ATP-binding cassette domain-containing protein [Chloroflexi bacterium]|nr:ATP-binding cassette domain-containing protein [Chloroflexota bacterium]MDA1296967.1 ATP-binding cassette domain-containing protein [Chloroflexota bacterium]